MRFLEKLSRDFQNSYYKYSVVYIAIMVTLIFIALIAGWGT